MRIKATLFQHALACGWGCLTLTIVACERPPSADRTVRNGGRLPVAAGIFPIADALKQIGGDRVEVTTLLPPGQTPHGYEPTPLLAERLAGSRLLVLVGRGVDDWARRSAMASGARAPRILDLGSPANGPTRPPASQHLPEEHDHDDPEGHEGTDPHTWLDPVMMMGFCDRMADALCQLDPPEAETYRANARRFRKELDDLDKLCADRLKGLPRKEFVTLHAAFGLFADRYGLKQLALRHTHAEESGPKRMEELIAFIKRHRVKVVFGEPQFPRERMEAIARQAGVETAILDPIGAAGVPGRDGYIALMKTNLDTFVAALSQ